MIINIIACSAIIDWPTPESSAPRCWRSDTGYASELTQATASAITSGRESLVGNRDTA